MAAVLVLGTTMIAWKGVCECSGEERIEVRQTSKGEWPRTPWGAQKWNKSDGTDFPAQHTLLQVCHRVAAVPLKGSTIIAW